MNKGFTQSDWKLKKKSILLAKNLCAIKYRHFVDYIKCSDHYENLIKRIIFYFFTQV